MDENVEQVCITHAKCLRHIDGALSFLWQVEPARESIRESRYFVAAYMKTQINIVISFTPKAHIFEDHVIESMQDLNGVGDKNKYF